MKLYIIITDHKQRQQ